MIRTFARRIVHYFAQYFSEPKHSGIYRPSQYSGRHYHGIPVARIVYRDVMETAARVAA